MLKLILRVRDQKLRRHLCNASSYLKGLAVHDDIVFDVSRKDHIAFIGLNRPKAKNSLGQNLVKIFESAIQSLHNDKAIRCVVVGSLVANVFCAGADLKERKNLPENEVIPFVRRARMLFQLLAEIPMPTICAIDGPALGGGLELALACDIRIASENSTIGLVESRLGIIPGAGGTQRLPRLIGIAKAKELMFTARTLSGKEACDIGLVNDVVTQNDTGNAALLQSFIVAQKIICNGPIALRMIKAAVDEGVCISSVKEGLDVEEKCYSKVVPTKDRIEGIKAFFEKRKPSYQGC